MRRTTIVVWLASLLATCIVCGQDVFDAPDWPLFRLPPPEAIANANRDAPAADDAADAEVLSDETTEDSKEEESVELVPVPDVVWYQPTTWFVPSIWDLGFQFGLNDATGNTETFSMQIGADANRKTDEGELDLKLRYSKGQNSGVESQNQAILNARNEWVLGESPWSLFSTGTLEYDRFRAFDLRLATHAGLGYQFVETEKVDLAGRFGSGVSREIGGPDDSYVPEASFAGDFKWQIGDSQKLTTTVVYYPDYSSYTDFRLNTNAGWEIALSGPMDISLKLAVIDRYDSTPNGRKANDLSTVFLVIWKP